VFVEAAAMAVPSCRAKEIRRLHQREVEKQLDFVAVGAAKVLE
jgi:hypothetical protein